MKNLELRPTTIATRTGPADVTPTRVATFITSKKGRQLLSLKLPDGRTITSPAGFSECTGKPDVLESCWEAADLNVRRGTGLRLCPAPATVVNTALTSRAIIDGPVTLSGVTVGTYHLEVITRGVGEGHLDVTLDGLAPTTVAAFHTDGAGMTMVVNERWL